MSGKSINLFLIDGDPNGRIKATLTNWTGLAYKIPRTDIEKSSDRKDLSQSGVYFLFGKSEKDDKPVVYVGQAGLRKSGEGILNRLKEHKRNQKKDYWTESVLFTTMNNSFGPTEISYLENRFCNLAREADRYEVKNGNDPNIGNLTEEKESELKEFIENAKVLMNVLGHKVFVPVSERQLEPKQSEEYKKEKDVVSKPDLFLKRRIKKLNFEVSGLGRQTSDGFVVLKGSVLSPEIDKNLATNIKELRKTAKIENNKLQEDVLFNSPSGASKFVIGKQSNGWKEWKDKDKRTLRDLEND